MDATTWLLQRRTALALLKEETQARLNVLIGGIAEVDYALENITREEEHTQALVATDLIFPPESGN